MYACFDLGGSSLKAAVMDEKGTIITQNILPIEDDFEVIMNQLVQYVDQAKQDFTIDGIGISAPGAVDSNTGLIYGTTAFKSIHGPNWKEEVKKRTGFEISIANDGNCAALAEIFSGNAEGLKDIVLIVCGTGIGGGIVKDAKLHLGAHLYGGEIGYMILNGETLESFSELGSTLSIVKRVMKHYPNQKWDGKKVFEEAEKGNQICQEAIESFYRYFAIGLYNVQHIYDPQKILIGGAISSRNDLIPNLRNSLEKLIETLGVNAAKTTLEVCKHAKDANLIGALALYLSEHQTDCNL